VDFNQSLKYLAGAWINACAQSITVLNKKLIFSSSQVIGCHTATCILVSYTKLSIVFSVRYLVIRLVPILLNQLVHLVTSIALSNFFNKVQGTFLVANISQAIGAICGKLSNNQFHTHLAHHNVFVIQLAFSSNTYRLASSSVTSYLPVISCFSSSVANHNCCNHQVIVFFAHNTVLFKAWNKLPVDAYSPASLKFLFNVY
jgi:hypothetical protein